LNTKPAESGLNGRTTKITAKVHPGSDNSKGSYRSKVTLMGSSATTTVAIFLMVSINSAYCKTNPKRPMHSRRLCVFGVLCGSIFMAPSGSKDGKG
jgi:hypothetical protein